MPNPINSIVSNADVSLDYDALADKPDMAVLVSKIFSVWAGVEYQLGILLMRVLCAVESPAVAIFSILKTQQLQLTALDVAAKSALPSNDYCVFQAAMSVCKTARKVRNQLAHWVWARCSQRPDLLLLADPEMIKQRNIEAAKYVIERIGQPIHWGQWRGLHTFDLNYVLAYSVADLQRALDNLIEAEEVIFQLEFYLHPEMLRSAYSDLTTQPDPNQIRADILNELNQGRLFREALVQANANPRNT